MSAVSLRRVGPALIFALVLAGRTAFSQSPTPPPSTVTFTEAQATRGGEVFGSVCLDCHARKDLNNPDFRTKWGGRTAFDFFELVRSTMPESNPGGLERAAYIDITAYMMQLNGLAPGSVALPEDEAGLKKQLLAFSK
jgi:hypothetical protein